MRNLMKAALVCGLMLSGCASGKNYANPHLAQLKGQHILALVDRADFADVCVREDGSKVYYLQNSAKSGEPGRACDEAAPSKLSAAFFVTDEDGVITGYDEIGGAPVANYEPMFADLFSPLKDER